MLNRLHQSISSNISICFLQHAESEPHALHKTRMNQEDTKTPKIPPPPSPPLRAPRPTPGTVTPTTQKKIQCMPKPIQPQIQQRIIYYYLIIIYSIYQSNSIQFDYLLGPVSMPSFATCFSKILVWHLII